MAVAQALGAAAGHAAPGPSRLPAQPTWYWQLQGRLPAHIDATLVDLDGFGTPAGTARSLDHAGHITVCYVDVGTWEAWRPDAGRFPRGLLGNANGWPGERWLDLRQRRLLGSIMARRIAMCARKGFAALEPDNLDPLGNHPGFAIGRADVLGYARMIAALAHADGLAVLQKNGPELVDALEPAFDGALTEQCREYDECAAFAPYVRAGKPVLDAEYNARLYPGFCAADRADKIQGALLDLALDGRRFRPCPPPSRA